MPSVLRDIRGAGMQNLIYPRLPRAEQRVVPTVLGFFYKTDPFNASMLARMDDYCVTNAEKYISWAAHDPRLVALFPFYYSGGYADNMVGLGELPRPADSRSLNQSISRGRPRRGLQRRGLRLMAAPATGSSPKSGPPKPCGTWKFKRIILKT